MAELNVDTEIDKLDAYWNNIVKQASPDWFLTLYKTGVESAICRKPTASLHEIEDWLAQIKKSSSKNNASLLGYNFINEEPSLLTAFEQITSKFPGYRPTKSTCQDVLCATDELFGKDIGNRLLYLYLRHGFNAGPDKVVNPTLTANNLEDITQAVEDFPATAFHSPKSRIFLSETENSIWAQTLISDDHKYNTMDFTETWNKLPTREYKQYTVTHEFGHMLNASLFGKMSDTLEWRKISSTEPLNKFSNLVLAKSAVSSYGMTSPSEDFAECVAAYRYNPKLLLGRSKAKYLFIKYAVYDGMEFLTPKNCKDNKPFSQELIKRFNTATNKENFESQINLYLANQKNIDSEIVRKVIIERVKLQLKK